MTIDRWDGHDVAGGGGRSGGGGGVFAASTHEATGESRGGVRTEHKGDDGGTGGEQREGNSRVDDGWVGTRWVAGATFFRLRPRA